MKYAELPASVRAQVDAQLGTTPKRRRSQKAATEGTTSQWRCATGDCRETFRNLAAMERHVEGHGGGRYEVLLR